MTKFLLFFCFISLFVSVSAQKKTAKSSSKNIEIVINDDGVTSELKPIPVAFSPGLTSAKFGAMYFGPDSESDISFILLLTGKTGVYAGDKDFGVKVLIDGLPLKNSTLRLVSSNEQRGKERLIQFMIKEEELAWMNAAQKLSFQIYNPDTAMLIHHVTFTNSALAELKDFAKSVYFIRSHQ